MTPEARLFAMTFALVLLAGVFFGLAHIGVWLQQRQASAPRVSSVPRRTMSSAEADEVIESAFVEAVASPAKEAAKPIATPQNGNNDAVVIAALARLVAAGKLGQTDAIKIGIGVTPSSTSTRYATIRDGLRAEVERLKGKDKPQFQLTPEQVAWRRAVGLEDV
jgi:hypothetical protein